MSYSKNPKNPKKSENFENSGNNQSTETYRIPDVFMDPFTDYGFKKLFGEEGSKVYLIDFLNSILEGQAPHIKELNYQKNEHLGQSELDRNAIFDLYCISPEGERFIIELQKVQQMFFKQRALYYSSFAIQEQAKKGAWDFNLKKVHCIGILNFSINDEGDEDEDEDEDEDDHKSSSAKKYITHAKISDIDTQQTVIEELAFTFIECPKFNKKITEKSSRRDKWLYALTQLTNLDHIPEELHESVFEDFFQRANVLKMSPNERAHYNNSMKYARDLHNIKYQNYDQGLAKGLEEGFNQGIEKGREEGIEQGIKKGIEKGIEKGREEGREEGIEQGKLLIIKKMLNLGRDAQEIIELTGCTLLEIEQAKFY